jgi:hypothetical protein
MASEGSAMENKVVRWGVHGGEGGQECNPTEEKVARKRTKE